MIFSVFQKKSGFEVQQNIVENTLPDGIETYGQRAYCLFCHISRHFWFFAFWWFCLFFKNIGFLGILGPPSYSIGATIRIGREMVCLPYAGFFYIPCYTPPFAVWNSSTNQFYQTNWSFYITKKISSFLGPFSKFQLKKIVPTFYLFVEF